MVGAQRQCSDIALKRRFIDSRMLLAEFDDIEQSDVLAREVAEMLRRRSGILCVWCHECSALFSNQRLTLQLNHRIFFFLLLNACSRRSNRAYLGAVIGE